MPKAFSFPNDVTQMWTPVTLQDPSDSHSYYLRMYARLAPTITFDAASARFAKLKNPQAPQGWSYLLTPMVRTDDSVRRWLWILFAAVCCFLLIVCSNVAGLALVRSFERQYEMAIRVALGASRWRVMRQVLPEVTMLATAGGIAGLAIAQIGVALLKQYAPVTPPTLEPAVFWFCAGISVVTGVVCGIYPAWRASQAASLWQRTRSFTGSRWQRALIVTEVGIATAMTICGGLLIHSFVRVLEQPPGFDARGVATMTISLPPLRYSQPEARARFFDTVLKQTAAIPGVDSAGACTLLPFGWGENMNTFEIAGKAKPAVAQYADMNIVSRDYFEAMRIPLRRGRLFTSGDRFGGALTAIVDEAFARRFLPGDDPLGHQIKMPWRPELYTISGVVGSVKASALDLDPPPTIYFSVAQTPVTDMMLAIRSSLPANEIARDVQRITSALDRDQPVYDVAPLESRIDRTLETRRFAVWLMLLFAAAGTGLAALGLYGLLAYTVALRRREIGIRMALGAGRRNVAMLVCREGMTLVAAGMLAGSAIALAAYRFIASQMYGVGLNDRMTWIAAAGVFCVAGLIACALPAWRAMRLNPSEALKTM
jgi:putative ABC transport system permease protein